MVLVVEGQRRRPAQPQQRRPQPRPQQRRQAPPQQRRQARPQQRRQVPPQQRRQTPPQQRRTQPPPRPQYQQRPAQRPRQQPNVSSQQARQQARADQLRSQQAAQRAQLARQQQQSRQLERRQEQQRREQTRRQQQMQQARTPQERQQLQAYQRAQRERERVRREAERARQRDQRQQGRGTTARPATPRPGPSVAGGAASVAKSSEDIIAGAKKMGLTVPQYLERMSQVAGGAAGMRDVATGLSNGRARETPAPARRPPTAGQGASQVTDFAADSIRAADSMGLQVPDALRQGSAAASTVKSVVNNVQDARKVAQDIAAGQRLPHNARSGAGLVVDFANSAIKVADGAGLAVPQGLRDSAELAGLAKSMNIKDTAINGLASIKAVATGDADELARVRADNISGRNGLPAQLAGYTGELISSATSGRGFVETLNDGRAALGDSALGRFGDMVGENAAKAVIGVERWWDR